MSRLFRRKLNFLRQREGIKLSKREVLFHVGKVFHKFWLLIVIPKHISRWIVYFPTFKLILVKECLFFWWMSRGYFVVKKSILNFFQTALRPLGFMFQLTNSAHFFFLKMILAKQRENQLLLLTNLMSVSHSFLPDCYK